MHRSTDDSLLSGQLERSDLIFLVVCILLAAAIRVDFLIAGHFVIDSDEAIVGLMAKHMTEGGPIPTFYYGQHYMGSLEALLAAASFLIFGISSWSLQLVPLLCSLALIPVVFALGRAVEESRSSRSLPTADARPGLSHIFTLPRMAALLTALPPVGLVVWSTKARGGFIEIVLLGAIAMLLTCRWLKAPALSIGYAVCVGLTLGIGWWVNNQIVYFILPISWFVFWHLVRACTVASERRANSLQLLRVVWCGTAGFIIGSSPYWIYNIEHDFPSLGMFGRASLEEMGEHTVGLLTTAIPILMGAKRFWESNGALTAPTIVYYCVYLAILGSVLMWRRRAIIRTCVGAIDTQRPIELFFGFVLVSCAVFAISTFGWLVQAPRYLLPVYVGLFILLAAGLEHVGRRRPWLKSCGIAALLVMNLASCFYPEQAVPGEPVVFKGERVSRDHKPLIDALERHGITKIRTNYWIGYRLAFETQERVTFVLLQEPRQVRIPTYEEIPEGVDRDTIPLVTVPSEGEVIRRALTALGYTFTIESLNGYRLFYDIKRDSTGLVRVPASSLSAQASVGTLNPMLAIDGQIGTRWGTGGHQVAGQQFVVTFAEPISLRSIQYELGQWPQDNPRGLSIEAVGPDGTRTVILDKQDYFALRYYSAENSEINLVFKSVVASQVVFTQTSQHPIFDWSIAELVFFAARDRR